MYPYYHNPNFRPQTPTNTTSTPDINDPNLHNNPGFINMVANMNMGAPIGSGFTPWVGSPSQNFGWASVPSSPGTMFDSQRMLPTTPETPLSTQPLPDIETVQETQIPIPDPAPTKKKRSHTKKNPDEPREKPNQINWSREEQMALARAWLEVTEDPLVANYQREKKYWSRVREIFHRIMDKGEYRMQDSINSKFRKMRVQISKFHAIYTHWTNRHVSGVTEADIRSNALAEYKADMKAPFNYLEEWAYLKDTSKFHMIRDWDPLTTHGASSKVSKTSASDSPSAHSSGSEARFHIDLNDAEGEGDTREVRYIRPTGRDAAKKKGKACSTGGGGKYTTDFGDLTDKLEGLIGVGKERAEFNKERLVIQKEKLEVKKHRQRNEDLATLAIDTSKLPEADRVAIEAWKDEIRSNLRK